jgi:hypothetical protein
MFIVGGWCYEPYFVKGTPEFKELMTSKEGEIFNSRIYFGNLFTQSGTSIMLMAFLSLVMRLEKWKIPHKSTLGILWEQIGIVYKHTIFHDFIEYVTKHI